MQDHYCRSPNTHAPVFLTHPCTRSSMIFVFPRISSTDAYLPCLVLPSIGMPRRRRSISITCMTLRSSPCLSTSAICPLVGRLLLPWLRSHPQSRLFSGSSPSVVPDRSGFERGSGCLWFGFDPVWGRHPTLGGSDVAMGTSAGRSGPRHTTSNLGRNMRRIRLERIASARKQAREPP